MPQTLDLTAGTIDYEDTGGSGPVVLFVHGLLVDGSLWRKVVSRARRLPLRRPDAAARLAP